MCILYSFCSRSLCRLYIFKLYDFTEWMEFNSKLISWLDRHSVFSSDENLDQSNSRNEKLNWFWKGKYIVSAKISNFNKNLALCGIFCFLLSFSSSLCWHMIGLPDFRWWAPNQIERLRNVKLLKEFPVLSRRPGVIYTLILRGLQSSRICQKASGMIAHLQGK